MSTLKDRAYTLFTQGGAEAVFAEARRRQHDRWGMCIACDCEVPVVAGECLLCGQDLRSLSLPRPVTLAQFKRAVATHALWEVRYDHRPAFWEPRVVVRVQSNAVAFAKSRDLAIIKKCEERPQARASWHWWGKAATYSASPDATGAIRHLIGTSWDDPNAGWMEYRAVDAYPVLERGHL